MHLKSLWIGIYQCHFERRVVKKILLFMLTSSLLSALTVTEVVNNLKIDGIQPLKTIADKLNSEFVKEGYKKVSDEVALDFLIKKNGLVMLKFFASWCGPCKNWAPIVASVAYENRTFKKNDKDISALYIEINTDQYRSISSKFSISNIPAGIVYFNGVQKQRFAGSTTKNVLVERLKQSLV
jgi:thioredoxin 1